MGEDLKSDQVPALSPAGRGPFKTIELLATPTQTSLPTVSPDCSAASLTSLTFLTYHTFIMAGPVLPRLPHSHGSSPQFSQACVKCHLLMGAPLPPNLKKLAPSPVLELVLPSVLLLLPATILCIHLFNCVSCLPQ